MKPNFNVPVKYGIVGALISCIYGFVAYLFYRQMFGSFTMMTMSGLFAFAFLLFICIFGGITFRRERGGVLSFTDAFLGVLIIYILTSAGGRLTSYLIPNVIDPQYPEQVLRLVKETTRESMEKFGAPDEQIDKAMSRMTLEQFKPDLLGTLKGFGFSLAFGAVLSLIIAAFIKRNADNTTQLLTDPGTNAGSTTP